MVLLVTGHDGSKAKGVVFYDDTQIVGDRPFKPYRLRTVAVLV